MHLFPRSDFNLVFVQALSVFYIKCIYLSANPYVYSDPAIKLQYYQELIIIGILTLWTTFGNKPQLYCTIIQYNYTLFYLILNK